MSSIILGGGLSTRLGKDKIQLDIAGESLLTRTVNRLSHISADIIIVIAQNQEIPSATASANVRFITDSQYRKGPLIGLYSGLKASHDEYSLVVACDMPFLSTGLLQYMMDNADGFDAVIPMVDGEVEPLHSVYSRNCIRSIETMIQENNLKVRDLLDTINVRYVEQPEIDLYDPEHLSWFNINTPADLERAQEILRREIKNSKTQSPNNQ